MVLDDTMLGFDVNARLMREWLQELTQRYARVHRVHVQYLQVVLEGPSPSLRGSVDCPCVSGREC